MSLTVPHAHLESILPEGQCNSSNLELNLKNSSVYLWSKTPGDCPLDLEPIASCHSCKAPSAERDHAMSRPWGARIYSVQLIESFPRFEAPDLSGNKKPRTQSVMCVALAEV